MKNKAGNKERNAKEVQPSKRAFYLLVLSLLVGATFILYSMFGTDSESPNKATLQPESSSTDEKTIARSNETLTPSANPPRSIWLDRKWVSGKFLNSSGRNSAEQQKIDENVRNLMNMFSQNKHSELIDQIDELIKQNPDIPEYHAIRGDYYFNMLEYDKARPSIERLLEFDDDNFVARTTLAKMDAVAGDYDKALDGVREVLKRDPGYTMGFQNLIELHFAKGQPEEGMKEAEKLFRDNPENGNLAAMYAQTLQDPIERKNLLQTVYSKNRGNPLLAQGLAREAYLSRDLEEALRMSEESLRGAKELRSSERMASESLYLEVLLELNREEEARSFVQNLSQDEPGHPGLDFYRARLSSASEWPQGFPRAVPAQ